MKCPNCGLVNNDCKVVDSRPFKHTIRRRRECSECNHRWTTYETTKEEILGMLHQRKSKSYVAWSPQEEITLVRMYQEGVSLKNISVKLGRNYTSVRHKKSRLDRSGRYFEIMNHFLS